MSFDTVAYKTALDSGDRDEIVRRAKSLMANENIEFLSENPAQPNAGQEDKEIEAQTKYFNKAALHLTGLFDQYNGASETNRGSYKTAIAESFQTLDYANRMLNEIDRILKGGGPGFGEDFLPISGPGYSVGEKVILKKLDEIVELLGSKKTPASTPTPSPTTATTSAKDKDKK